MYRVLQGDTALGEDVMYRVLQGILRQERMSLQSVAGILL